MQVHALTPEADLNLVATAIIPITGMQWLVQIAYQVAQPGKRLPLPVFIQPRMTQLICVFLDGLGHTQAIRTIPFLNIPGCVARDIDEVLGLAPGPFS